jgi:hypothetical protein
MLNQPVTIEMEAELPPKEKQFALISNPVFRRLFFLIRLVGCLIGILNLISEITYLTNHQFSSITYFSAYTSVCGLKALIPFTIILY